MTLVGLGQQAKNGHTNGRKVARIYFILLSAHESAEATANTQGETHLRTSGCSPSRFPSKLLCSKSRKIQALMDAQ